MDDRIATGTIQDFGRLMPLTEALAAILSVIEPVKPSRCPLWAAQGRIAAETVRSSNAYPSKRIALRDGYVAVSQETIGATPYAPAYLSGRLQAVRAGDIVAEGCDAVLPPDAVVVGSMGVEALRSAFPGSGVRHPGEDLGIGDTIIAAGHRLRPDRLALLALARFESVAVRVPRLSVEGTGPLADMVAAFASACGASIDDSADVDATIVLCGPGYAASAAAVQRFSAQGRLIAHGLAVKPGASTALFTVRRNDGTIRLVFIVPDRLEDVVAAWLLIVRPCFTALTGATAVENSDVFPISSKIVSEPGLADLVLLRRTVAIEPSWEPIATGDLPWSAFTTAEAYCLLAAEQEGFPAGALVRGFLL